MIFEGFRENRREKVTKTEAKNAASANYDANETPRPLFLSDQPAEYSKYRRSSGYTLWKVRRVRFCLIFPKELDDKNMYWFSRSTTT